MLFLGRRGGVGLGEFYFAEFGGVGEVIDAVDSEVLEEGIGGLVEEGAAGEFGAAADADEVAVEEFLDHAVAGDAADGFDGGFGDGLAVGDDGEGFHGGAGESFRFSAGEELSDEVSEFGFGVDFPALGAFEDGEGTVGVGVSFIEFGDGFGGLFRGCVGEG